MSRNQWLILIALAVGLLYWLRRTQAASTPQALNVATIKAKNAAAGITTGIYNAADLGYTSPFADSSPYAGKTFALDITPHSASNNLPFDPAQSTIVI